MNTSGKGKTDTSRSTWSHIPGSLLKHIKTLLFIVILVGGGFYIYLHRKDFSILLRFNPLLIPHLVAANVALLLLNGIISREMIKALGARQRFSEWFGLAAVNAMGNYLGPAHVGAVARAVYLNRVLGLSYGYYLSYLITSYAILASAAGACGLVVLWWAGLGRALANPWLWVVCGILMGGVPVVCCFFGGLKWLKRLSPRFSDSFVRGWQILWRQPRLLLAVWGTQVAFVVTYGAEIWIAYRSIGLPVGFGHATFLALLPMLSYVINVVPGNLGIGEASLGLGAIIIGQDFDQAVTISLVIRCVTIFVVFALGTLFTILLAGSRNNSKHAPGARSRKKGGGSMTEGNHIRAFYDEFHTRPNHLLNKVMEDLRYRYLRQEVSRYPGSILIIGCGSKREMAIVTQGHTEVWGIDISETAIEKNRARFPAFNFRRMDACAMTFPENSFDVVVCSEVIEHLPDRSKFLDDVRRILKSGGTFILTTPNWCSWYGLARAIAERIGGRPFTSDDQPIDNWAHPGELIRELKKRNFSITKVRGLWYLPPFGKGKYRLPGLVTYPLYLAFYPFEKVLSFALPTFGHMIALTMVKSSTAGYAEATEPAKCVTNSST